MGAANTTVLPARRGIPARSGRALVLAAALAALLIGCYLAAFHDGSVAHADASAYLTFATIGRAHPGLAGLAQHLVGLCQPDPYVFLAAAAVGIALLRRRWMLALALVVMIPGAVISAEVLKPLLAHPRPAGLAMTSLGGTGSWPSGHSTAAMALAMAFVLASPARWRPYVAAVGAAFALAVIYSLLTLGWHYPSDALGGVLVASIWSLLAAAAVWIADARFGRELSVYGPDRSTWLTYLPSVPAMVAVALLPAAAVVLAHGAQAGAYAAANTAFVSALIAVGAAVALAPAGLSLVLSGSDRAARGARPARWRPG